MSIRDRLQPALLDRLTDLDPSSQKEADDRRVMTKTQLREAVLRDLSWLLNAVQGLDTQSTDHTTAYPYAADSVLNYGLPALTGKQASRVDVSQLERIIKQTIIHFEPRVLPDSLQVKAIEVPSILDTHNAIEFEISGLLWAQPVPLDLLLRTRIDLEGGQFDVRELNGAQPLRRT